MTATVSSPSTRPPSIRKVRDLRRVERRVAAVVLLVPGIAAALSRLFTTDDSDARKALDLVAADPGRQFTLALLGFIAMLTMVPAFLAAARLARRRRPLLTMIALGVNLIAYLSGWAVPALDTMYLAASRLPVEQRDAAAALIDAMWSEGLTGTSTMIMVIGQLLGAILMGLALRGSIPTVGWVAMILSQPIHILAFALNVFDPAALAWGLTALAFTFCAVTVLRTPDGEWDLPPLCPARSHPQHDRSSDEQEQAQPRHRERVPPYTSALVASRPRLPHRGTPGRSPAGRTRPPRRPTPAQPVRTSR